MDWSPAAALYDCQLMLERPALRGALDLLNPTSAEELLDLGTGTGAVLRELAGRCERPQRAVGIDRSSAMLAHVPRLPEGWELTEADATALPFDDASFDLVTAAFLLHVVDGVVRDGIVREARRILRAGGRFATVTPTWPRTAIAKRLYAPIVTVATGSTGWLRGLRPLDPRPLLDAAGFRISAARDVGLGYPSLCVVAVVPG